MSGTVNLVDGSFVREPLVEPPNTPTLGLRSLKAKIRGPGRDVLIMDLDFLRDIPLAPPDVTIAVEPYFRTTIRADEWTQVGDESFTFPRQSDGLLAARLNYFSRRIRVVVKRGTLFDPVPLSDSTSGAFGPIVLRLDPSVPNERVQPINGPAPVRIVVRIDDDEIESRVHVLTRKGKKLVY